MPRKPGQPSGEAPMPEAAELGVEEKEVELPAEMEAIFDFIDSAQGGLHDKRRVYDENGLTGLIEGIKTNDFRDWTAFLKRMSEKYMGHRNFLKWDGMTTDTMFGFVRYGDMTIFDRLSQEMRKRTDKNLQNLFDIPEDRFFPEDVEPEVANELVKVMAEIYENHMPDWQQRPFKRDVFGGLRHVTEQEIADADRDAYESGAARARFDSNMSIGFWTLIKNIGKLGNRDTIDTLLRLVENPELTTSSPHDTFSEIDPAYAADKLLEHMRSADSLDRTHNADPDVSKGETKVRDRMSEILWRLEFGKIDVSEEGVKYLNKLYRFGAEFDPDEYDFARRISPHGHVAMFANGGEMKKFFNLANLDSVEDTIEAQLHDITLSLLFEEREGETHEEVALKEELLDKFRKQYGEFYSDRFFSATGVKMNNLSLREQAWFMQFAFQANKADQEKAFQLVKQFGEQGFRTFLSVEYDAEAGDKVFDVVDNFKDDEVRSIFNKFGEIAMAAEEIEQKVARFFKDDSRSVQNPGRATREIMKKAGRVISDFASQKGDEAVEDVYQKLDLIQRDIVIFGSIFKTVLKTEGKVDLKDIQGLEYQTLSAESLRGDDGLAEIRDQMIDVVEQNYEGVPAAKSEGPVNEVKKLLTEEGDTEFHVLTRENDKGETDVVSFVRYDMPEGWEGSRYGGSFNTNPKYREYIIGYALLDRTIEEVGKNAPIEAQVYADLSAGTRYVEDFDFVIDSVSVRKQEDQDRVYLWVRRDKKLKDKLETKNKSAYTIEKLTSMTFEGDLPNKWDDASQPKIVVRKYNYKDDQQKIGFEVGNMTSHSYVVSRYFTDPKDKKVRYYIFELDPDAALL